MVEAKCPRCNRPMHWNGRLKIFICETDGFILGPNDPYVKRLEYENSQVLQPRLVIEDEPGPE
ncbi:hypothetical protein AUF78_11335 [archaeon 13_1_20CM_2_51_12]|nr:MAG: hypothetical protein AUF78_11335 [archaeon 13_1_20CM_2_51_12]